MQLFDVVGFLGTRGRQLFHVAAKGIPVDAVVDFVRPAFRSAVVRSHIGAIDVITKSRIEIPSDAFAIDTDANIGHREVVNLLA